MTALVICPGCDGKRTRGGLSCETCCGAGRVFPTFARETLVSLLGEAIGERLARQAIKTLRDNPAQLVDWLLEVEVIRTTAFGLRFRDRDQSDSRPYRDTQRLPEVVPGDAADKRLYTLQVPA